MDIVIRRPATKGTFVDLVLPQTASLTDQRLWLLSSLTSAVSVRGTSLFTDSDTLVYVDGEQKHTVGRGTNLEAIVDELLPEEASEGVAYGDGLQGAERLKPSTRLHETVVWFRFCG